MNATAYLARVKSRHRFACPCGARRPGRELSWPRWRFRVTVYRECEDRSCLGPLGVALAPLYGAKHHHPVQLGPYPPETPVCPAHTLEKVSS